MHPVIIGWLNATPSPKAFILIMTSWIAISVIVALAIRKLDKNGTFDDLSLFSLSFVVFGSIFAIVLLAGFAEGIFLLLKNGGA